jgi:hypothetical protein
LSHACLVERVRPLGQPLLPARLVDVDRRLRDGTQPLVENGDPGQELVRIGHGGCLQAYLTGA